MFAELVTLSLLAAAPPITNTVTDEHRAHSLKSLEEAYAAVPEPTVLLAIANLHTDWPGHCKEARAAIERFFEACSDCSSLPAAASSLDEIDATCRETTPDDAIAAAAARRKLRDPKGIYALGKLIALVDKLQPKRAAQLRTALSAAQGNVVGLNAIRRQTWEVLQQKPQTIENAEWILDPLLSLDQVSYRELSAKLDQAKKDKGLVDLSDLPVALLDEPSQAGAELSQERQRMLRSCVIRQRDLFGYVTVNTNPASEVFFDEHLLGETPLAKVRLPAGCVILRAVNKESGKTRRVKVFVEPNKTTRYSVPL